MQSSRPIQITSTLLLFLSLILSAYTTKYPQGLNFTRQLFIEVIAPVGKTSTGLLNSFEYVWTQYISLVNTESKNTELESRLRTLIAENARLSEVLHENGQLKKLLGVKEQFAWRVIAGKVIGHEPSPWSKGITINRGSNDGVQTNLPIVDGDAIVGKVVHVASSASQVLLLTDRNAGIDAFIQSTRARGIFMGDGKSGGVLQYISNDNQVQIGDNIVSSGMDGIYPGGVLIGTINSVEKKSGELFQEIHVTAKINADALENVLVILGEPNAK